MSAIARNAMPIIAFCEECGARLQLTPEEVARAPGYIHCRTCSEVIKIAQPKKLLNDLELRLGGKVVNMDPARPILTMGRKRHNDIIIQGPKISRTHSTVVYLDGRYTLFDLSMNGTFVRFDSGEEVVLRKNRIDLYGCGLIGLGKSLPSNLGERIFFKVKNG
ncbi:MAG: FHA domain-containing protein [Thermodesulfobacteriota bacterium]